MGRIFDLKVRKKSKKIQLLVLTHSACLYKNYGPKCSKYFFQASNTLRKKNNLVLRQCSCHRVLHSIASKL